MFGTGGHAHTGIAGQGPKIAYSNLSGSPTTMEPATHSSATTTYGVSTASAYGHAMASSAAPLVNGTAAAGTDNGKFAREGHVHPTDITRAPLASPALSGIPAAPTAAAGNNSTQIATTAFVQAAFTAGSLKYIEIHDEKASGTNDGTFTSGAWRTRVLNTITANDDSIASLNTNQITLPAGTYIVDASAPVMGVDLNQMRLYNITDDVTLLTGTTENSFASLDGNSVITHAFLSGKFTLPAPKVLELQHRCTSTCTNYGFGYPCSLGTEVYAVIKFWKVG